MNKRLISLLLLLLAPLPAWAAITVTHLTNGVDAADLASYATASITPTANACVIVSVATRKGTSTVNGPVVPTLTGNGLTYTQVFTRQNATTEGGTGNSRITVFRAMGASPSAGAITIDLSAETQSHAAWSVTQFTGTDTSGTHCSGALVQSNSTNSAIAGGSTSPATVTLGSAPSSATNLTYGWVRIFANNVITVGTGYTSLSQDAETVDLARYLAEYKLNAQTADATFTNTGWIIGAIEIKDAVAAVTCRGALSLMGVGGC